jgi:protein-L-isoaspartate(D-aspartate) O-methyltransferase
MAPSAMESENGKSNQLRQEMVDRLKNLRLVSSELVEEALRTVPRHLFVPHVDVGTAYNDQAVVTRWQDGEAISSASAPSIVALMLELLDLRPGQRVLEIGAGTGYNAALMARLVGESGQVVTIDIDDEIVQEARAHLKAVGVENVQVICGDGALGWSEGAPYDRVILTASVADLVPAWHEQLVRGGRLVGPLRLLEFHSKLTEPPLLPDQFLLAFEWTGDYFESLALLPCVFVPLRGDFASAVRGASADKVEGELSASLPAGIEARNTFALLRGSAEDETTEVHLAFQEMFGLRMWLALRETHFCEVYVPESANIGTIPAFLRRDKTFATALGLCETDTCCLLKLEEEAEEQPVDLKRPFRLVIRRFGEDRALAERLRQQVEAWDRAGHPFVWSMDGFGARMANMHLRAFPRDEYALPEVQNYDTLLARRHTRFLFKRSEEEIHA